MKDKTIKFRVNVLQREVIRYNAKRSGLTVSEFVRSAVFEAEIKSRLTPKEIEIYMELIKYKQNFKNISNLFKKGNYALVEKESIKTAQLIQTHLKKFQ